ncbi:unnamed protein product [Notodromas monacha]|uniref:UMP-CMP kinase n=1 Tax=Notodromas monacha TaxID=399045 RepID=A0A7R9BNN6_9CRUS|nr:unnamed protein product [Notodromas monacha]CAG0918010.1 unnamed protein product [Notodromas monacha]
MAALPEVVFVLGGPGSGKGTQCSKIIKEFEFVHLSAGDLLRDEQANKESEVGQLIEYHIVNGTIVPVEITCELLHKAMKASGKHKFLIDGFPRNEDNLSGWTKNMADKTVVKLVLCMDCSDDICIERCMGRGAAGSGRSDDNLTSLKKRLVTFRSATLPIVEHYDKLGLLRRINAERPAEQVVFALLCYFGVMIVTVQPFLEPRGFIRALEFIFAIAAFASVTNFVGSIGFDYDCGTGKTEAVRLTVPYPFHLGSHSENKILCGATKPTKFTFFGDYSSDAQFFVGTGVLSMLWAMITVAVYLLGEQNYRLDKRLRYVDFGLTLVLATFWLAGSGAWANGLSGLKHETDPVEYIRTPQFLYGLDMAKLHNPRSGSFAALTISVLLGFLNFIMWTGNTWFLYKELKDEQGENGVPNQSVPAAAGP